MMNQVVQVVITKEGSAHCSEGVESDTVGTAFVHTGAALVKVRQYCLSGEQSYAR